MLFVILALTLWDIPMGFETILKYILKSFVNHYETSLWDLKLIRSQIDNDLTVIMRHPYGIWNRLILMSLFWVMHYETSLWDLKLWVFLLFLLVLYIMRHPYGIWNPLYFSCAVWHIRLWDIPMGFETTFSICSIRYRFFIMRHPYGIWNELARIILNGKNILWDIPMGFETFHRPYLYISCDWLWDIPMGFETNG